MAPESMWLKPVPIQLATNPVDSCIERLDRIFQKFWERLEQRSRQMQSGPVKVVKGVAER
ncbi:Hypothetical predicted protein, partial [Pelobates cultripes]